MEAAVCRLSSKQVILTIWQYSKENTYVTVSFNKAVLRQKKVFLFPEIGQVKNFYHSPGRMVEYVSEYIIFNFKKQTYKQKEKKKKKKKKQKETKKEKRIYPENRLKK